MKPYGSGYFGEWITDEQGLPAYRYDCDQLTDPAAISPTNPVWRQENDHTFQFGNTRITCVASNFGTVQVRQDEGSPKLLSDIDPEAHCYGGGIGWLSIGRNVLSTYYDGMNDGFQRVFGAGYMRKIVKKDYLSVNQLIFTPYGDDPVLISQVTIENSSNQEVKAKWHEYWGAKPYPLSFRALLLALIGNGGKLETYINDSAKELRRKLAEKYKHDFSVEGSTLRNKMKFSGWSFVEKKVWKIAQNKYRPLVETRKNYSLWLNDLNDHEDVNPPETFLSAIKTPVEMFITDNKAFFGEDGVENPGGLSTHQKETRKKHHSAMIAVSPVTIPAGGKVTLTYIFGYVPEGFEYSALLKKYDTDIDKLFEDSCEKWKGDRISLKVPNQEWIDRELLWHNQSLIGSVTYDTAFKEHILSQGHVYQYIMGFQGAARDPLQHVMPFIFTNPNLVREVLRYTFKSMLPDGTIPYGICGHGAIMVTPFLSGDLEIWLLWILSEYILATKDVSILNERVTPYPYKGEKQPDESILNLAQRCLKHFLDFTGMGAHGLPRILGGDWNDNVVVGNSDPAEQDRIYKEGESVLVGAMTSAVMEKYAEVLNMAGEDSSDVLKLAEQQREAVARQWNGKWFRRAYLGSNIGWVDEETLWLEPQPWALMCGATNPEQTAQLVAELKEKCQDISPIGAIICDKCPDRTMKAPVGMATNGGIWPSITGTLIMALNKIDPAAAYEEWKKNTLANHSDNYPKSWEGTWSGPDTYNSVFAEIPGRTFYISDPEQRKGRLSWVDYPVYNLHPHAWTLFNAANLFAESFTSEGVIFNMGFPEKEYSFSSSLVSLERSASGYKGSYNPAVSGTWKIELTFFNPEKEYALTVNGQSAQYEQTESGIIFYGDGGNQNPLLWELK